MHHGKAFIFFSRPSPQSSPSFRVWSRYLELSLRFPLRNAIFVPFVCFLFFEPRRIVMRNFQGIYLLSTNRGNRNKKVPETYNVEGLGTSPSCSLRGLQHLRALASLPCRFFQHARFISAFLLPFVKTKLYQRFSEPPA